MVDVTARLVWYRLGEAYSKMVEAATSAQSWYSTMDWEKVDLLDVFFFGGLVATVVMYGVCQIMFSMFGKQIQAWTSKTSVKQTGQAQNFGESAAWVNSAVNWMYLHYTTTPEFVQAWMTSMNETSRQHGENLQVKFDMIQPGSLPPKVTNIHTDVGPSDTLNIRAKVETVELSFMVGVLHTIMDNISVSNCTVSIEKLKGELKVVAAMEANNVSVSVSFHGTPDIKLRIKPHSSHYDLNISRVETAIMNAISSTVTTLSLSRGPHNQFSSVPSSPHSPHLSVNTFATSPIMPVNEVITRTDDLHLHSANIVTKPPGQRRLLVKIIKANGLRQAEYGSTDAYVVIEMDDPLQKHTTSVVKNTVNPFWDEHFLFDLADSTHEVMFELYDREKPPGEDFLGCNIVHMEELRRNPSSRQIIPLLPRPDKQELVTGSITIEFLFLEPAEAAMYQTQLEAMTPRRQIDTARHVTPGGTVITTTTTTTERPRDMPYDTSISDQMQPIDINKSATLPARMTESPTDELPHKDAISTTSSVDKKSKSLKNTLKKRFSRLRKPRSQSADRAASMRESSLKPPGLTVTGPKTTDDLDYLQVPDGQNLKKSRSNSFSNSLKRLFRKKKRDGASVSRESSLSRNSQPDYMGDHSPEPSPIMAQRDGMMSDPMMSDPSRSRYS